MAIPRERDRDRDRDRDRESKDGGKRKFRAPLVRYHLPADAVIEYKNVSLLQKYLNDRGKIVPRRISGISAKDQRKLVSAIKKARFLSLLTTGRVRNRENRY